ncbi:MAG: FtsX-like permease family protein [Actinomycetota bacterium]
MATLRFLLKRFAAQRLLGLAVVVTLAFSVGVLVAGPIYADAAREAILSSTLHGAAVTVVNARFQVYSGQGFSWAKADASVIDATRALPVQRLIRQGLTTVRLGGASGPSVPLLFRDGMENDLAFKGSAPGPGQIAVVAGTPETAGLKIGDQVAIVGPSGRELELTVSGTFLPPKAGDPFWFGDRSPFPAPGSTQAPPVVVARDTALEAAQRLDLTTAYSWDVYLALTGMPFEQARTLPDQLNGIAADLQREPGLSGINVSSGLATLMTIVEQRVQNLRIPILLVVFQIGAVTLAVLAGVGALALTRQAFELSVLHSRGFSRRTLLFAQALQAVIAGIVAFPLGLVLGMGLARLASHANGPSLPGVRFPVHLNAAADILGLASAAAGVLILLLLSLPYTSRTILEERRIVSREDRPLLARLPVELIVLPVGLFAYIQLRGGTKPAPGSGSIEPLVLIAPTLLLFAASFLALRLFLFVAHRMDGRIGRTRRLPIYLAGRKLSRAPGTGFAAALLLLLSVGLLVVSTSYRAIVIRNHSDAAHALVGADWNIEISPPSATLRAVEHMPPRTTPIISADPDFETGSFALPPSTLAIDPATYAQAGWWRSDFSSTSLPDLLAGLRTPAAGVALPPGASTLTLTIDAPRSAAGLGLSATVLDANDVAHTAPTQPLAAGRGTYEVGLAPGTRLLSITLQSRTDFSLANKIPLEIASAAVDGAPLSLDTWGPLTWRGSTGTLKASGSGSTFAFHPGAGTVVAGLVPRPAPMPVIVSPSVASQESSTFTVTLGGQQIELHQIGVADQFPSEVPNAPFIVLSTVGLLERELAVPEAGLTLNEVWATGAASPLPALRAAGFIPGTVQRTAPIEGVLAQLPQSLAVGMNFTAAAGGVGLVVIGVTAGLYFAQRRRDYEFAALRAMGAERSQIRRTLILEQALLLGFAILAGLGLGYLMLRMVMPYIGTSLGVSYPPPVLVMDGTSLGVALAAILAATALGLGLVTRTLMRSSVTGVLRGEAE